MPKQVPHVPSAGKSFGPYSPVVEANNFVFLAGQLGTDGEGNLLEGVAEQTRGAMERIGALLNDVGLDYEAVVKTTVFLADIDDFAAMNEVYATFFPVHPPARSAFQVGRLPRGAAVEIEAIAVR